MMTRRMPVSRGCDVEPGKAPRAAGVMLAAEETVPAIEAMPVAIAVLKNCRRFSDAMRKPVSVMRAILYPKEGCDGDSTRIVGWDRTPSYAAIPAKRRIT